MPWPTLTDNPLDGDDLADMGFLVLVGVEGDLGHIIVRRGLKEVLTLLDAGLIDSPVVNNSR